MLGALLEGVDREALSGHDRVELLKARARLISHMQAELHADVVSVAQAIRSEPWVDDEEQLIDATALELATALRLTRRAAEGLTDQALLLSGLGPVMAALSEGRIDLARARIIADLTTHLPRKEANQVAAKVVEEASRLTTGQLRARLSGLIIGNDPAAAKERYENRLEERRVVCRPGADGTAELHGHHLPADRATAAMRRLTWLAKRAKRAGDRRPLDQIRADLYLEALAGDHHAESDSKKGPGVLIHLRADLATLAGLDDEPAEIPGWGPVIADVARRVVETHSNIRWQVTTTGLEGSEPAVVISRRRPTISQRRAVEAVNPECVFPTCRMPAVDSDLNHEVPWAEAHRTTVDELGPLCRHHHVAHHQRGWTLKRIAPGHYQWTSPLGHTYRNRARPP